jgi:hypothetical protein
MSKKSLRIQQIYDRIGLPGHNPGNGKFYLSNDGYEFDEIYEIKGQFNILGEFNLEISTETLSTGEMSLSVKTYSDISRAAIDVERFLFINEAMNEGEELALLTAFRDAMNDRIEELIDDNG